MKAGLTCSNPDCRVYTGGPEENIGVAAHITGASSDGPRYDGSLSTEERKAERNGIWLCQSCAKLIDSRTHPKRYPRPLLELWKQIAENRARAYLGSSSPFLGDLRPVANQHGRLLELSAAANDYQLFESISGHPYVFSTTKTTREQIRAHSSPSRVLDWAADIIIECWPDGDPELLGICSVLLTTSLDQWNPTDDVLTKLESLCRDALQAGDSTRIGVVEPVLFAVAAKGRSAGYVQFLTASVEDKSLRGAEDARSKQYYGSEGEKAAAIARHLSDAHRTGLVRANDIGRLLTLVTKPTTDLSRPPVRRLLLGLIRESLHELQAAGQQDLVSQAARFLVTYGIDLESG
jgi:hypothetical protein